MKRTWQKEIILETIKNMKNHPTADDVYKEICKHNNDIGIATVYRNLNAFAQKGLISKVIIPNASDRFDYRTDNHEHFLCEKCGKVYDANVTVKIIPTQGSMNYTGYSLTLFGICDECSAAHENSIC